MLKKSTEIHLFLNIYLKNIFLVQTCRAGEISIVFFWGACFGCLNSKSDRYDPSRSFQFSDCNCTPQCRQSAVRPNFLFSPKWRERVWGQPLRLNTMGQKVYQYDNDGTIYIYMAATFWIWKKWFLGWFRTVCLGNLFGSLLAPHVAKKNIASDIRGSSNRSQSLSQHLWKKNYPNKADLIGWFKHTNVPRKKTFVTNPPKGWSQTLLTESAKDTTLYSRPWVPSKPAARWILLRIFKVFGFFSSCFFNSFPIHFITQLWFATISSDMMGIHIIYNIYCTV